MNVNLDGKWSSFNRGVYPNSAVSQVSEREV